MGKVTLPCKQPASFRNEIVLHSTEQCQHGVAVRGELAALRFQASMFRAVQHICVLRRHEWLIILYGELSLLIHNTRILKQCIRKKQKPNNARMKLHCLIHKAILIFRLKCQNWQGLKLKFRPMYHSFIKPKSLFWLFLILKVLIMEDDFVQCQLKFFGIFFSFFFFAFRNCLG